MTDQLNEVGRSASEQAQARRRLEQERDELQGALEAAESNLEAEELKVQKGLQEIAAIRQSIDKRLAEKDEEFESTRFGLSLHLSLL